MLKTLFLDASGAPAASMFLVEGHTIVAVMFTFSTSKTLATDIELTTVPTAASGNGLLRLRSAATSSGEQSVTQVLKDLNFKVFKGDTLRLFNANSLGACICNVLVTGRVTSRHSSGTLS
jgi:hypothetical protein